MVGGGAEGADGNDSYFSAKRKDELEMGANMTADKQT